MALYDWNHDGKKDWQDNIIEYQIYKESTGQKDIPSYKPSRGNGMSTFGTVISVVAGLFLQAALYTMLGIDVDDVPVLVIIILWAVFSTLAALVVEKIGL